MFPASGNLSVGNVRDGLGLPAGLVSMSQFRGRSIFNADGSTYTVPASGALSIGSFRGKYYLRPPATVVYNAGQTSISKPGTANPIKVTFTLYGAGGGGGMGQDGWSGYNPAYGANGINGGESGAGGGSGGKRITPVITFSNQAISCAIGTGGRGGNPDDGSYGVDGNNTELTISGTTYTVFGGRGGEGDSFGGSILSNVGGAGGVGATQNGNSGFNGNLGGFSQFTPPPGGPRADGGAGLDGYGAGGYGGAGGNASGTNPENGGAGANGNIIGYWEYF